MASDLGRLFGTWSHLRHVQRSRS